MVMVAVSLSLLWEAQQGRYSRQLDDAGGFCTLRRDLNELFAAG